MEGVWILLLCFTCTGAIMVNNSGSGGSNNTDKSDQLITQETQIKRSAAYGGYYPDDHHYGYDHGVDYYPHHHHAPESPHHYHHYDAFKALLVPLAGVALLGAAAIFASNPILLQLGVVQGKRRRRGIEERHLQDWVMLEKFVSNLPTTAVEQQNRRMLANYLSCSGGCVQRVTCEVRYHGAPEDIHILDMVISEIMHNEFIDEKLKKSIMKARKSGHSTENCKEYFCSELEKMKNIV